MHLNPYLTCSVKIDRVLELRVGAYGDCHLGDNIGLTTVGGCEGSVAGDLVGVLGSEGPGVFGSDTPGVLGSDTAEGAEVVARSLVPGSNAGWCS